MRRSQPTPTTRDSFAEVLVSRVDPDAIELASRMRRAATLFRWPELMDADPAVALPSLAWLNG